MLKAPFKAITMDLEANQRQADQRDLKNTLLKPQVGFQVLGGYCCCLAQLTSVVSKGITKLILTLRRNLKRAFMTTT